MIKRLTVLLTFSSITIQAMQFDLAYDKKHRIISAWCQDYTTSYTATYRLDTKEFGYSIGPVHTNTKPSSETSEEKMPEIGYTRHLLNRIRTYLMLNGFNPQSPELLYIHRLFYGMQDK